MGFPLTPNPFSQPNHLDQKWQHLVGGQVPFSAQTQWWTLTHRTADYGGVINENHLLSCPFLGVFQGILSQSYPPLFFHTTWTSSVQMMDKGVFWFWDAIIRRRREGKVPAPATTFKHLHPSVRASERTLHTQVACARINPKTSFLLFSLYWSALVNKARVCENLIIATQSRISCEDWGGGSAVCEREREWENERKREGESRKERVEVEGVRPCLCMQKCARTHVIADHI